VWHGCSLCLDTSDGKIYSNRFESIHAAEKFRFRTTAITLKLRASLCCKIASWEHSRQCHQLLLQRQLKALLHCGPASHGFGGLVQQLQDQSPEPLVWTVEGGSNRAVNRIELNRFLFCRIAHHYSILTVTSRSCLGLGIIHFIYNPDVWYIVACTYNGPLGMTTGEIRAGQISASSNYPPEWDRGCSEKYARVYQPADQAWCAKYKSASEWLQVDLGVPAKVVFYTRCRCS